MRPALVPLAEEEGIAEAIEDFIVAMEYEDTCRAWRLANKFEEQPN